MNKTVKTDVLIVGAGPTGLTLAAQLIRYGINFIIIDQKDGVTNLSKALVVHARTLEIFDELGLAQQAVVNGEIAQEADFLINGRVGGKIDFGNMGQGLSPFPYMLIYEQSKTEQLLYDYLQKHGHEVQWGTKLTTLKQDQHGVVAMVMPVSEQEQTQASSAAWTEENGQAIEAKFVVGADGASSPVRHLLNIGFEGTTNARMFFVADVEMKFAGDAGTLYVAFHDNFFILLVPMEGTQHWRLIGNLPDYDGQSEPQVNYEEIEQKVKDVIQQPLDVTKVRWFSTYRVHTRSAETFSLGRCFLAGDAAHIHTPAGGQGMNTGIQDAYNLAWKVAFVLKEMAADTLLATYNEERLENAKKLLASTDKFFDLMVNGNRLTRFLRDNFVPGLVGFLAQFGVTREAIFPSISQIGINYRQQSLSQHVDDTDFRVKAGDRMPYFRVEGGNVYTHFHNPKFHVILFSDGEQDFANLTNSLTNQYSDRLDTTVLPLLPRVVHLFGIDEPFMVLLRPDGHIALISQTINEFTVINYLMNTIGKG
ncbi:FAD-dependent monooxygenase [Spirosoma sp. SC4-14]|uniref:FAD-dependent monooxygenase n=1 Tax=Spirosoma sp. SC4-14 TaxID=3128900 RepID=UPI0030D1EBC1